MSLFKAFVNWMGLDARTSDLLRDDNNASDVQNVEVNKKGALIKRDGFAKQNTTGSNEGGNGLFNYSNNSKLLSFGANGVSAFAGTTWSNETSGGGITPDTTNIASSTQNLENMYLANGVNELLKYDGLSWYRAGVLNSSVDNVRSVVDNGAAAGALTVEYRAEYINRDRNEFISTGLLYDIENNANPLYTADSLASSTTTQLVTFIGPCKKWAEMISRGLTTNVWQQGVSRAASYIALAPDNRIYISLVITSGINTGAGNELVDFQSEVALGEWLELITFVNFEPTGYDTRGAIVNGNQASVNTVTVLGGAYLHDVQVGDVIKVPNAGITTTQYRNVTAVTATTITFDGYPTTFDNLYPISVGNYINIYTRDASVGGDFQQGICLYSGITSEAGSIPNNPFTVLQSETFLRTDLATPGPAFVQAVTANGLDARGTPPTGANYPVIFQQALVVALDDHNIGFSRNKFVEEFPGSDQQIRIGDSVDGIIKGLAVSDEFLVVKKENATYVVSGNLNLGNIRVDKLYGFGLGCSSHATIKEVENELIYLNKRGIFAMAGAGRPAELSIKINQLISDDPNLDLDNAVAVNDVNRQKYFIYIPSSGTDLFLEYDYFHNSWWVFTNHDFSGGVTIYDDNLYWVDSTPHLQKRTPGVYNDNTVAIDAFWKSQWFHFGTPSTYKKVTDFLGYALETLNFTLRVRTEKNWVTGTYDTDETLTFDADNRVVKTNLAGKKPQSTRIVLSNNVLDEGIELTGYELEVEGPQRQKLKKI